MGREHWVEIKLINISEIIMGQSPNSSSYNIRKEGLPFFQGKAEFGDLSPIAVKYCSEPTRIAEVNDILLSVRAPVGPTNIANAKCCIGRGLAAIRPMPGYELTFLYQYFKHIEPWFSKEGTGSTFSAIKKDVLHNLDIPLPPLNEQKCIVEKLDSILPKVKSAKARLGKIPTILKKFRQSVLAAVCSGRLTVDWREGKNLPEWDNKKLKELIEKGSTISYGVLKPGPHDINGVPLIKSQHIRQNTVATIIQSKISKKLDEKYKRTKIKGDEILLTLVGASIGRLAIAPICHLGANVSRAIAVIRLDKTYYNKWVLFYLINLMTDVFIKENASGTAQPVLNIEVIKEINIPLPPLEEQQEIVRCVEKLFSLADFLEEKYNKAMERVEKIEQAVLAKAFRGELVEADPNDEPASELLRRILEEKAKLEAGAKKKTTRKKK